MICLWSGFNLYSKKGQNLMEEVLYCSMLYTLKWEGEHASPKPLNNKPINGSFAKSYLLSKSSCLFFFFSIGKNRDLSPTQMQSSAKDLSLYPKRLTDPMKHLQNFTKAQKQSYISLLGFSDTKALFKMKNVPT